MKKPVTPLTVIQLAWVVESAIICVQTIVAWWVCFALNDQVYFGVWMNSVPIMAMLIGGQGAAASAGPLISDKIKSIVTLGGKKEGR
jgi:hypothetical protein